MHGEIIKFGTYPIYCYFLLRAEVAKVMFKRKSRLRYLPHCWLRNLKKLLICTMHGLIRKRSTTSAKKSGLPPHSFLEETNSLSLKRPLPHVYTSLFRMASCRVLCEICDEQESQNSFKYSTKYTPPSPEHCKKSKAIPVQVWTGPGSSRRLKLSDF
jgi:hypothetical protein